MRPRSTQRFLPGPILVSLACVSLLLVSCAGKTTIGPDPKLVVIEQRPTEPPQWYKDNSPASVKAPDGVKCFIARASRVNSAKVAQEAAFSDGVVQVVSYVAGDLLDSQLDEIMKGGGNPADRYTVELARTVVTMGETLGGKSINQSFDRSYYYKSDPKTVYFDHYDLLFVEGDRLAKELASKIDEQAAQETDETRQKLQERAQKLRDGWRNAHQP